MPSKQEAALTDVDVVVVDDEETTREGCRKALESAGYKIATATDGAQGMALLQKLRPRMAVLDLKSPGLAGTEFLKKVREIDPRIVPVVTTGEASVETAVDSMKAGAFEFLAKPFKTDKLLDTVQRGLSQWGTFVPAAAYKGPVAAAGERVVRSEEDVLLKSLDALQEFYDLGGTSSTLADKLRALEEQADYHAHQLGLIKKKGQALKEFVADLHKVDEILARHQFKRNALIQILLDIQAEKNWLPRHALLWVERRLGVPFARILEIATFYEAFSLEPQGRHQVQVCMGTACHVRHAPELSATISALLGVKAGETDSRLLFTFKEVHCLGCCALAPVVRVDDAYYGNPSLKQLKEIFAACEKADAEGAK